MFFNREKRITYLGFDDIWFIAIGVVVLSLFIDFIFNNSFANQPFVNAFINWSISLFFSIVNWLVLRRVLISLRIKYPHFQDNIKRLSLIHI